MRKPTAKDRVEYALTRALEAGVALMPDAAARRFGTAIGAMVRAPLGIRVGTVRENLRRAFPGLPEAWYDRVEREAYRHLGREAVEMIRLSHLPRERVFELADIPAWSEFEAARAEGKGVLLVTGHYGNWEVAAASVAARGVPISAVVKRQRNRLVDARVEAARRRLGIGTIPMEDAKREIPELLARGGVVGIVADQDAGRRGVWVPFFGIPSSTFRGPALLALRFDAPVLTAVARRRPDGRYDIDARRLEVRRTGDLEADVLHLTHAMARRLEDEVRKEPGQYFWFHKRWKTAPPAELPPELFGTTPADRNPGS